MMGDKGIDHFIQRFAGHDLVELVEREMDPVVGQSALRKIIGANAFGAIPGTDLGTPVGGALGVEPLALRLKDADRSNIMARARFLCCERSSCTKTIVFVGKWVMRTANFVVNMLAAGTLRAHRIDLQIRFINIDIHILGFGQNRDSCRRSMYAALGLGFRHPLHPMRSGLGISTARRRRAPRFRR